MSHSQSHHLTPLRGKLPLKSKISTHWQADWYLGKKIKPDSDLLGGRYSYELGSVYVYHIYIYIIYMCIYIYINTEIYHHHNYTTLLQEDRSWLAATPAALGSASPGSRFFKAAISWSCSYLACRDQNHGTYGKYMG